MCVPGCQESVVRRLSRRGFLRAAGALSGLALTGCGSSSSGSSEASNASNNNKEEAKTSFSRVVDLTHTLTPNFPTYGGESQLEVETLFTLADNGYNMYKWTLVEHTGTHMDAPFHFSDQDSA
ncbi:MAG: cyclase family protein, partial [Ardenticatenaceae bacterium]